jgi:hypothetical protein
MSVIYGSAVRKSKVRVIKWRRIRCAAHVASMGEGRGVYRVLVGKPDPWGDSGVDGRITLEWIFKARDAGVRIGLGWLRIGTDGGHL